MSDRLKVAICFSGQPRSFLKGQDYYELNLYDDVRYDVDVFMHTWISTDFTRKKFHALVDEGPVDVKCCFTPAFRREQFNGYRVVNPNFPAFNTFSMFYSIAECNALKREHELTNGFRYDAVIRTRYDYALNRPLDLDKLEHDKVYVPNDRYDPEKRICADMFAYGKSEVMDRYSMTWHNIERLYRMGFPINGEELLSGNLQLNGLTGENMVYVSMNNPFPPGPYNCNSHAFIRDDFRDWNTHR